MASTRLGLASHHTFTCSRAYTRPRIHTKIHATRCFSTTLKRSEQHNHRKESFRSRLSDALGKTEIKWYPIPVGLGVGFLGFLQFYRSQQREKRRQEEEAARSGGEDGSAVGRPKKRDRIRPEGPWYIWSRKQSWTYILMLGRQVQIMSTLPLKAISRVWGRFNEMQIPYYLRVPGFKLYGWIFGVKSVSKVLQCVII